MKTQVAIRLLCISSLLFICTSCKKYSKDLTTVNFHVYNPISGEGLSGVKVQVMEQEDVTGAFQVESEYETKVIWEGVTDTDGKASYSFNAMKKDKFTYWHSADINYIKSNGRKLLQQADFQEEIKNSVNNNEYTFTVPAFFKLQYKNVNCQDNNDRFKIRYKWKYNSSQFGWSNWSNDQFSCYDSGVSSLWNSYNDYFICEYEVERLGLTNTYLDTFYISPYSVDTFKVFY